MGKDEIDRIVDELIKDILSPEGRKSLDEAMAQAEKANAEYLEKIMIKDWSILHQRITI